MIAHLWARNAVVAGALGSANWTAAAGCQGIPARRRVTGVGRWFRAGIQPGYEGAGGDSNNQAQLYDTVGRRYFIGTTVRLGAR